MGGRNCEEEVGIFEKVNLGTDHSLAAVGVTVMPGLLSLAVMMAP